MATLNICNRQMHDGVSVAHRCSAGLQLTLSPSGADTMRSNCPEFFSFDRGKILNRNVDKFCRDLLISSAGLRTTVKLLRDQIG